VIHTGSLVKAAPEPVDIAFTCLGCGYNLSGLPQSATACPECGRPIDRRVSDDPLGPVSASEASSARSGAFLAWLGLVGVILVPVLGALVEGLGWWQLSAGPGKGRRSAMLLRVGIRALTVLSTLGQAAAWVALFDVYVVRVVVTNSVVDDIAVVVLASVAIGLWTLRHLAGCWWLGRLGRRIPEPSLVGLAMVSGVGAAALMLSGFVLIVLGVLVSHIALFPPVCFLLPIWAGSLAIWWFVTGLLLARVRKALSVPKNTAADPSFARTLGYDAG